MLRRLMATAVLTAAGVVATGGCAVLDDDDRLQRDGGERGDITTEPTEDDAGGELPRSGRVAPELTLPDLETGETWSLTDHLDPTGETCPRGFLLAFMASWCTYCTESLPTLVALEREHPDLAVVTVTVDDGPEPQHAELRKVRAAGLAGPVLAADEEAVRRWVGTGRAVPKYYFVDRAGTVVAKDDGFGDKVRPMMPGQAARALRE